MSGEDRVGQRKQTGRTDTTETIVKYEIREDHRTNKYMDKSTSINAYILQQLAPHIRYYHGLHREKI